MLARLMLCAVLAAGCAEVDDVGVGTDSAAVSVTWTDLVGVTASGNDLTKTGTVGAFDSGAASVESLAVEGYLEFTTLETSTKQAGLSSGNSHEGPADIDFAIRLAATGAVQVFEAGVLRGTFGSYAAGDLFRVAVEDGFVTYRRNGALLYVSTLAPTFPLLVDTSFRTPGATIHDAVLVTTGVELQNAVGVAVGDGDDLTKTATTPGWTAGASTVQTLAGDGFAEFTAGEATTMKAAGLSSDDGSQHVSDIDFAIRLTALGRIQVMEGGVLIGNFGSYVAGDRFRVEVRAGVVEYSSNGNRPFYTSAVAPTSPLLFDSSLYTRGATLRDVVLRAAADACPAYEPIGVTCSGSFIIYNEFDVAEIAHCASITGNLTISAPGMTEVALPNLRRVGRTLQVTGSPDLTRLRLPRLRQVQDLSIDLDPGPAPQIDLSSLRVGGSISSRFARELSAPCLEEAGELFAYKTSGGEAAYLPRLRAVAGRITGGSESPITTPALETAGAVSATLRAPVLTSIAGDVSGQLDAAALISIGGDVRVFALEAPSLTDVGGQLDYHTGHSVPALERVGSVVLYEAPVVDLPALEEVSGAFRGGCYVTNPAATAIALPSLRRAGGISLCWEGLTAVDLPALEVITGAGSDTALSISSSNLASVELPALVRVEAGSVSIWRPTSAPALTAVGGYLFLGNTLTAPALRTVRELMIRAPTSLDALAEVERLLRIQSFATETAISLPALTSVGGLSVTSYNLTGLELPALTTVTGGWTATLAGDFEVVGTRVPTIAVPLLTAVAGDLRLENNDAMTSIDFSSLTSLGPTLRIIGNVVLPTCYANGLRDQLLASGWTGTARISGNGTGTCP